MTQLRSITLGASLIALAACADSPTIVTPTLSPATAQSEANSPLKRYVAIGTSISMGWQSEGANAASQREGWPAQLAALSGTTFELPLISGFGCKAPFAAPLASGRRISGEPVTTPDDQLSCAPLVSGIDLPTRNVAIAGATTFDALYRTPETVPSVFGQSLYSRILPPGATQLHAALNQRPRVISVELGANEVLGARSGIAIVGVSIFPPNAWMPLYRALVDTVVMKTPQVVVVGLIKDAASFPSFRRGAEIFVDAPTMLGAFNVMVSSDCDGSQNLIFVPVRIPTAVSIGLTNRANNLPPFVFSCADGGTGVPDYVLTPAEAGIVNQTLAQMTSFIKSVADRHRLAYFALEELYGLPGLKPTFSAVQLMTSAQPYGSYITLDGIHPSAAGSAVLARAAAQALNARYNLHLPDGTPFIASR